MKELLPRPEPDELLTPEVGSWADDKYAIVSLYNTLFSSGMKNKWGQRVYIDLYSGAGVVTVRGTDRRIFGSPLLALQVKDPFDKYIFCEEDPARLAALKERVKRLSPTAKAHFIGGKCDERVVEIKAAIPKASKNNTVLTLCFVDPFDIGISFRTLGQLASRFTDFLVLLALQMDANRNEANYVRTHSTKVELFLGNPDWRAKWRTAQQSGIRFPQFLAEAFSESMQALGYLPPPPMKSIRLTENNVVLYKLALFSKNQQAHKFWDEVLKYSSDQILMPF
jgi:three-Cys-motif partner protein